VIVARATLTPIRTLLCGDVTFPARGKFPMSLENADHRRDDRRKLHVGWATADLTRDGEVWRGQIVVDGYRWDVTAYPGSPAWEVEFDG